MNVLREAINEIREFGFRRWWAREVLRTREAQAKAAAEAMKLTDEDLVW